MITLLLTLSLMVLGQENEAGPRTIELTPSNSTSIRGVVNWNSMSQLQADVMRLSLNLRPDEPIYLVIDSPGGGVISGEMFIETLKGIPNPVHAVVISGYSMGFQITQSADKRFIMGNGSLMSHRARIGLRGQMDGELESRLKFYKDIVESMEVRAAKRLGMELGVYKSAIINEMWAFGQQAVDMNMADEVVVVRCSGALAKKRVERTVFSFFGGSRKITYSGCPLITTPLAQVRSYETEEDTEYFNTLFNNKALFFEKYIKTGLFR